MPPTGECFNLATLHTAQWPLDARRQDGAGTECRCIHSCGFNSTSSFRFVSWAAGLIDGSRRDFDAGDELQETYVLTARSQLDDKERSEERESLLAYLADAEADPRNIQYKKVSSFTTTMSLLTTEASTTRRRYSSRSSRSSRARRRTPSSHFSSTSSSTS